MLSFSNSSLSLAAQPVSGSSIPPPQAYTPSLKILKRPTSGSSSPSSSGQSTPRTEKQSMQDRERAYREARTRIFGEASAENSDNEDQKKKTVSQPATTARKQQTGKKDRSQSQTPGLGPVTTIIREPINPPSKGSVKGFNTKRRQKPLSAAALEFKPSFALPSSSIATSPATGVTSPSAASPASSTASIRINPLASQFSTVSVQDRS